MRRHLFMVAVLGVLLSTGQAGAAPSPPASLPLKRVRLYDSGVAYFERGGVFDAQKSASLPVPTGHLDDALKTLVVLSGDGELSVTGFEFSSSASRPLALALAGLPPEGDGSLSYVALLRSLKGASAEIRTAQERVRGRVIDVVEPSAEQPPECGLPPATTETGATHANAVSGWSESCARARAPSLLVLTDGAGIRRFHASDLVAVEPTDPAFRARLATALDTLSSRGAQTTRDVRLQASRGKSVTLGYVAEAPIWRSTYRLVLDRTADSATLQGWALLHNDTDESWHQVQVELVNGRPDSFLFPLAAPRYARRELVTPEQELSTVPQLLETTVDNLWAGDGEVAGIGGLGLSGIGEGGGGRGEGIGLGRIGVHRLGNVADGVAVSDLLAVGNLAEVTVAEGAEVGALFRYAIAAPMDLRAHGSALVPFVQRSISARRIATFEQPGAVARSAVHVVNDSSQTLPAGPISIFADGGFAGESALSRTKPKESRIVRFGFDLDVELSLQGTVTHDVPKVLVATDDTITEHFVRTHELDYLLVNRSAAPRTAYLKLAFVRNSEIEGAERTAFDAETDAAHAVFDMAAQQRVARKVIVREGLARTHPLAALSRQAVDALAGAESLPEAQRVLLRSAGTHLLTAERLSRKAEDRTTQRQGVEERVDRLRATLDALRGREVDGADELAERLLDTETKVEQLRKEIEEAHAGARVEQLRARGELRKLRGG